MTAPPSFPIRLTHNGHARLIIGMLLVNAFVLPIVMVLIFVITGLLILPLALLIAGFLFVAEMVGAFILKRNLKPARVTLDKTSITVTPLTLFGQANETEAQQFIATDVQDLVVANPTPNRRSLHLRFKDGQQITIAPLPGSVDGEQLLAQLRSAWHLHKNDTQE